MGCIETIRFHIILRANRRSILTNQGLKSQPSKRPWLDRQGVSPFNIRMIRGHFQQTTAIMLLFSQLLLLLMGGPLMVQCEGAGGHQAVELAHNSPCEGGDEASREADVLKAPQLSPEDCVDTPLAQPPVPRQDDRPSFQTIPVLLAYHQVEPDQTPRPICRAPLHISSPDSPESLARSVILLI